MRLWDRLRTWGDDEARSAQTYRRLAESAELECDGQAALLRQPDLRFALDWQKFQQPNAAWAARYRAGFDAMLDFLQRSPRAFDVKTRAHRAQRAEQTRLLERQRRWRNGLFVMLPLIVALAAVSVTALYYWRDPDAEPARSAAVVAKTRAESAQADAKREAAEARAAQTAVAAAQRRLADVETAERNTPELRPAIQQAQQAQQAVQNKALVYMQYADSNQKDMMMRLAAQLGKVGFSAPGSERVSVAPRRLELRYFRRDDVTGATEPAELLKCWNFGSLVFNCVN
jgi:hypothetical protein